MLFKQTFAAEVDLQSIPLKTAARRSAVDYPEQSKMPPSLTLTAQASSSRALSLAKMRQKVQAKLPTFDEVDEIRVAREGEQRTFQALTINWKAFLQAEHQQERLDKD
eukprot:IDg2952t1